VYRSTHAVTKLPAFIAGSRKLATYKGRPLQLNTAQRTTNLICYPHWLLIWLLGKAATTIVPVIFVTGSDPVQLGLVASLNHPGGNVTGISFQVAPTVAKWLELLSELVPSASTVGFLVNPHNPNGETATVDAQDAAKKLGKRLITIKAATENDLDVAFTDLVQESRGTDGCS
jgi:hypothetical protein